MSSTRSEILKACKDEELSRVRELYNSMSDSASKGSTLDAMILTAAENNRPEIVQFCLDEGAEASYEVIIEAYDHPKIAQVLITAGAMDVNHDFEMAGDLLINAICARNVSSSDLSLLPIIKKEQENTLSLKKGMFCMPLLFERATILTYAWYLVDAS